MTSSPRPKPPADGSTPPDGHRPRHLPPHGPAGRRSRRSRRPKRLGSVWSVAQHPSHPDARLIEPWLLETIVQIVATYTRPGHRVLLLAPPTGPRAPASELATSSIRSGDGLLPALIEAAGTASRLGRTVEAHTTDLHFPSCIAENESPARSESVHRLEADPVPTPPTGHRPVRCRRGPTAVGPDRFDAVIAPVDPYEPDWVSSVSWSGLLAAAGVLAFITHSDHSRGRLIDPRGSVTRIASGTGLALLDRVALLQVPVRDDALVPEPDLLAVLPADNAQCPPGPRHTRAHADLLLFTHARHAANPTGEEC